MDWDIDERLAWFHQFIFVSEGPTNFGWKRYVDSNSQIIYSYRNGRCCNFETLCEDHLGEEQ